MASHPILDTSTIIGYRSQIERVLFSAFIPSIVFFELLATSVDHSELKTLTRWHNALKKADRILSPTENDFWETGKSINRLYLKKAAQESKLLTLRTDALIARLAVKSKNFIVTADIVLLGRFCVDWEKLSKAKVRSSNFSWRLPPEEAN